MANSYYVYIMTNRRRTTVYTGMTNNIQRRVHEHRYHLVPGFTDRYNLEYLVFLEEINNVQSAIEREKQIKGWSRAKKNALIESINPTWKDLSSEWHTHETPQPAMEVKRGSSLRSE